MAFAQLTLFSIILTLFQMKQSLGNEDCSIEIKNKTLIAQQEKCPKKMFYSFRIQSCKACRECPVGFGISCKCQHVLNTECKKCSLGEYSAKTQMGRVCMPCSHCKIYEMVASPCNGTHNTICVQDNTVKSQKEKENKKTVMKQKDPTVYIKIISVLGTITLLVFIILCVVVIVHKRRQNVNVEGDENEVEPTLASERRAIDASSYSSAEDPRMRRFLFRPDTDSMESSLLSASGSEKEARGLLNPDVLLSSLPARVLESLGKHLNPSLLYKDWQSLAGRLGFTALEIRNIQLSPRQDFTEQVLFNYGTRFPNAKIGQLYDVFLEIERSDCAAVLRAFDAQNVRITTPV